MIAVQNRTLWLTLAIALAAPVAEAREVLLIYGGVTDDPFYELTVRDARSDYVRDRVVGLVGGEQLADRFASLVFLEGEGSIRACAGGDPPDLTLLDQEIERLRADLDYGGQIDQYTEAIEDLVCAGSQLARSDVVGLYVDRALAHFKNGDEYAARSDFRRAFAIDPRRAWDERHTPRARRLFDKARAETSADVNPVHLAAGGLHGSGIRIDGRPLRAHAPLRIGSGDHVITWQSQDGGGDCGLLTLRGPVTLIGAEGLHAFLFRDPRDVSEERLREDVLAQLTRWEGVDELVLLQPNDLRGRPVRGRTPGPRFGAAVSLGYARFSEDDYFAIPVELWIRLVAGLHVDLRLDLALSQGPTTVVLSEGEEYDFQEPIRDTYLLPAFQFGIGWRHGRGPVQPGGGVGLKLLFSGPGSLVLPAIVGHGGVDIRPWAAPLAIHVHAQVGMIAGDGGDDLAGRGLGVDASRIVVGFAAGMAWHH